MILPDHEIARYCQIYGMVEDYDPDLINPASLDVRLGPTIMVEDAVDDELRAVSIAHTTKEDPFYLQPGQFILAETIETFNLPDDICAQFVLKSSRGREGISHALCGYCDPGWHGSRLTMELHCLRQLHPVKLWHGMKIGQMKFELMLSAPLRDYSQTGRYNMDKSVQPSRG